MDASCYSLTLYVYSFIFFDFSLDFCIFLCYLFLMFACSYFDYKLSHFHFVLTDALASVISAGISGGSSLIGSGLGFAGTMLTNKQNERMWREQFDYEKGLQQQVFQREDTALQRARQDAVQAGFSPLQALGMQSSANGVVSTTPSTPMQAPDFSGIGSGIADASRLYLEKQMHDDQMQLESMRLGKEDEWNRARLSNEKDIAVNNNDTAISINRARLDQEALQFNRQLSEVIRSNSAQETLQAQKQLDDFVGKYDMPVTPYSDYEHYTHAILNWYRQYNQWLMSDSGLTNDSESFGASSSSSSSSSHGIDSSRSSSVGSNAFGTGVSASASRSNGSSDSSSSSSSSSESGSWSRQTLNAAKLRAYAYYNPIPVYRASHENY